jgi:lipopolysaccharide export system permease protein
MKSIGQALSRYVFWQTAGALLLILLSLTSVVWIAVALRQLELVTTQGQDAIRFVAMTTLAIPSLLAFVAPIALLIASIHVLNRMNGDSELIVMTAGGAPVWTLLKPLGLLAFLVALAVAAVNHIAGPWSQSTLKDYSILVRTDLLGQVIQPWRFMEPEPRLTVHIRDRTSDGQLLGLFLHDAREPKQTTSYLAERAQIIKQSSNAFLRMEKGHIVRRPEGEASPQIVSFAEYTVDLNQLEQRADRSPTARPRERYTSELLSLGADEPSAKSGRGRVTAELHERFSSPLYPFTFVLIVLAFMGGAQTTRQGRLNGVIGAFSLATLSRIVGIAANNTVVVRPAAAPLLYAIPVGAGLLAAFVAYRRVVPRPESGLIRRLTTPLGAGPARLRRRYSEWRTRRRLRSADRGGHLLLSRTLRRYVAKRFLFSIVGAFLVCSCLIFMIDMIELLRMSRRAPDLAIGTLAWMGLLRLPAFAEILFAFAVLVGSIGALLTLNRKSELIVMRSAGMSAWQFLRPGLTVALLLGILAVTMFNPLAAAARFEAERLLAEVFGKEAGLLAAAGERSWLRQDGADGQSVLNARAVAEQGLALTGVIAFQFDAKGRFIEQIDAARAILQDGYWELHKVTVSRPMREAEVFSTYSLSTYLTREKVGDALGSEIAVSFWQLPSLREVSEKAGLSADKYRMQHALLLSRPALLIAMVVLAATVSLRSFRSGGIHTMVLAGMLGGIGFFLLAEVSRQIGVSGLLSPTLAVWVPISVALLVSITVLLHQEDG